MAATAPGGRVQTSPTRQETSVSSGPFSPAVSMTPWPSVPSESLSPVSRNLCVFCRAALTRVISRPSGPQLAAAARPSPAPFASSLCAPRCPANKRNTRPV